MAIYDVNGNQIVNAYDINGNTLTQAYDYNGNPVLGGANLTVMTFNVKVFQDINSQQALLNGIISKYTFLTDPKYGQGLTDEEAQKELERIRAESPGNISDSLSIFNAGG